VSEVNAGVKKLADSNDGHGRVLSFTVPACPAGILLVSRRQPPSVCATDVDRW